VLVVGTDNASTVLSQLHRAGEPHAATVGSVVSLNTGVYHPVVVFHFTCLCIKMQLTVSKWLV